ncbi:MAG: bifunctional DNA-formamidopyrimidine glycosylase/DNA-(apurinic or apyrimidinic site) lyase [Pseudomonadota bacterium]
MPELPEVETVRRGLAPTLVNRSIEAVDLRRPDLRFPFPSRFVDRLVGTRIEALDRRAKYLLARLSSGEVLVMHLGMSGRFWLSGAVPKGETSGAGSVGEAGRAHQITQLNPAHDHVVFRLSGGIELVFHDPRRFGFMDIASGLDIGAHKFFRHLGVEPLGADFTAAYLTERFKGRRTPIKAALLDQTVIVGIGNIYACEALYRARVSPRRQAATIGPKRAERLVPAIKSVLQEAIEAGGSSLRDFAGADGEMGYFQHRFEVYGRGGEACLRGGCAGGVRRIVQSGRSSFYCPTCQR